MKLPLILRECWIEITRVRLYCTGGEHRDRMNPTWYLVPISIMMPITWDLTGM